MRTLPCAENQPLRKPSSSTWGISVQVRVTSYTSRGPGIGGRGRGDDGVPAPLGLEHASLVWHCRRVTPSVPHVGLSRENS